MARSGSTLLARELDRYKAIGITIEDDIPDGLLEGEKVVISDDKELNCFLDELYSKPKFAFWEINRSHLEKKLKEEASYPLYIGTILEKIYEIYFSEQSFEVWIHKKGRYYLKIEELKSHFPEAKFIFLKRDPRALFNSQKSSKDSRSGQQMSSNIIAFALGYREMYNLTKQYKNLDFFYSLTYEELIDNFDKKTDDILNFLALQHREKENNDYYYKIPGPQRNLHKNIQQPPIKERKTVWEKELSKKEIAILESCLEKEIRNEGYCLTGKKPGNIFQRMIVFERVGVFFLKYHLPGIMPGFYARLSAIKEKFRKREK